MMKKARYVGIDLGTTNSTVSVAEVTASGEIRSETLEVQQYNGQHMVFNKELPSTIYFDEQSVPQVGVYAKHMQLIEPKQTLSKVKRYIGKEATWDINGERYAPEHISSFVLKKLKKTAESRFFGEEINQAVITVPANFNFQQQAKTKIAAELAGFDPENIHMIPEPTAALIHFLNEENQKAVEFRSLDLSKGSKTILVFDLGGGTCDVTIQRVNQDGKRLNLQELSISQYTELGGTDFDEKVLKYLLEKLLKERGVTPKQLNEKYGNGFVAPLKELLLEIAEKAKLDFSRQVSAREQMLDESYYDKPEAFDEIRYNHSLYGIPKELEGELSITKAEMDRVIEPLLYQKSENEIENIEYPIMNAIVNANVPLTVDDIDHIFLVGGMTAYPTIKGRIYELFKKKPDAVTNPMHSVSSGAAIYHYYQSEIDISQVGEGRIYPQNVFIRVLEGEPVCLLQKGMAIPTERHFDTGFHVAGSGSEYVTTMALDLFTAEKPDDIRQQQLKNAVLAFENPVRVGEPLTLRVTVDHERNVDVKAWLTNDETQMITVNLGVRESTEEEKARMTKQFEAMTKSEKGAIEKW